MTYKLIGAGMILLSCGGYGFSLAARIRWEERALTQLQGTLEWMICELEYRHTPLPRLCLLASQRGGILAPVFHGLGQNLESHIAPNATQSMAQAMEHAGHLPPMTRQLLVELGRCLGKFDLSGQIMGLRSVIALCQRDLQELRKDQALRLRGYRTLGICAGAALVIILL